MRLSDLQAKGVPVRFEDGQPLKLSQLGGAARFEAAQQGTPDDLEHFGANFTKGVAKGIGSTLRGIDTLARKVPGLGGFLDKVNSISEQNNATADRLLKTQNTTQKVGFGAEQLAEFLIPSSAIAKGVKVAEGVADAAKLGTYGSIAAKVGARAALEGAGAGAVRAAQTGSATQGVKAGGAAGVVTGVFGAGGAALRALGIPEKLYSQIFKNTYDDMTEALRTGALQDLRQRFPEKFQELVEQGIIKVGKDGAVKYNPTLAREALDHGLRGSITNMSNEVVRNTLTLEQKARQIASGYETPLKIPDARKYVNLLQQIQKQYQGTFLESRAEEAGGFVKAIKSGQTDATTALNLRRFLDRMRVASSYRPNTHLSIGQEDFKVASDQLRGILNRIPGMGEVMNNYRFYIEALTSLGKEAARRKNAAVINLIDTALFGFGGGLAGPEGAAGLPLVRRALTVPSVVTGLGTKIEQGTQGAVGRVLRGAASTLLTPKQ